MLTTPSINSELLIEKISSFGTELTSMAQKSPAGHEKLELKVKWHDVPVKLEPGIQAVHLSPEVLPSLDPRRGPRNRWTDKQKEVLCVLVRWYDIDWVAFSRVFNQRFAKDLYACGYKQSMSLGTVKLYYYDMCAPMLQDVFDSTDFADEKLCYRYLRNELESIANLTGVILQARLQEDITMLEQSQARWFKKQARLKSGRLTSKTKGPLRSLHWEREAWCERSDSEDRSFEEELPSIIPTEPARKQGGDRQFSGPIREPINRSRPLPKLIFRCYDKNNQGCNSPTRFCAGVFHGESSSSLSIQNPLPVEDENFLKYAANHLQRGQNFSPLISTTDSFLWVLHKAMTSFNSPDTEIHIAVIDVDAVSRGSYIYYARNLLSVLTRKGMIDRAKIRCYKGQFEWLVWGQIGGGAIIHDFTLADLKAFARAQPSVDEFLRLESIAASNNCTTAYARFQPLSVDRELGCTLAQIALFLGLGLQRVRGLLSPLITCLLRNWAVVEGEGAWTYNKTFTGGLIHHLSCCGIDLPISSFFQPTSTERPRMDSCQNETVDRSITPLTPSKSSQYHGNIGSPRNRGTISGLVTPPETPRGQVDPRIIIPHARVRVGGQNIEPIELHTSIKCPETYSPITPPWTPERTRKTLYSGGPGTPTSVQSDEDQALCSSPCNGRTRSHKIAQQSTPTSSSRKRRAVDVSTGSRARVNSIGSPVCSKIRLHDEEQLASPFSATRDSNTEPDGFIAPKRLTFRRDISQFFCDPRRSQELLDATKRAPPEPKPLGCNNIFQGWSSTSDYEGSGEHRTPQCQPHHDMPISSPKPTSVTSSDEEASFNIQSPLPSTLTTVDDFILSVRVYASQDSPASRKRKISQMLNEMDDEDQHLCHDSLGDVAFVSRSDDTVPDGEEDDLDNWDTGTDGAGEEAGIANDEEDQAEHQEEDVSLVSPEAILALKRQIWLQFSEDGV